ncbi:MAG: tRNA pseudouridine(38-40) synthase TruA [Polycyclovorans sp.]|nr:tRNA pseudouridine(38-40) synthase TruA [Polycyclovorans sp.]|tara:strand:+ start:1050 stop:1841 length:792 start_codon:yes stop_codon:yes gene_type:complete
MSQRWAAGVEYLGSAYSGWQRLPERSTVQGAVEAALGTVAHQPVRVITAGRTDAGVHALQQVIHFDCDAARTPYAWLLGSNSLLPPDVSLRWVMPVDERFHARFEAHSREYRYLILNQRARSAVWGGRATWEMRPLDAAAMHRAAQCLRGEHDFSSFRDTRCQAPSPVRRLADIAVVRDGEMIGVSVRGNAFLHHMVRNIVGSLIDVGLGRQPETWIAEVLAARDRRLAGMTAAADGLYFVGPRYPAHFAIPPPPPWPFPTGP